MDSVWVERLVYKDDEWQWVAKRENFDTATDFAIDEGNLNLEICRSGHLLVRYGDLAAQMQANLKRTEENVKLVKDRVSGAERSTAEAKGEKMTEGKLAEKVTIDSQYQQALNELHVLRADAIKAEHWWRSIVKKIDLVNALAYRQHAEIKRMPG